MKYLGAVNDVDRIYSLIWNTHLRDKYLLSNSRPPPPSSSSTASQSSNTTVVQEKEDQPASKKRKVYKFQRAWLKEFGEWLEWDSEKELMRCIFCKAFPMHASSSLVDGCDNFKRETLVKHSKSKSTSIAETVTWTLVLVAVLKLQHSKKQFQKFLPDRKRTSALICNESLKFNSMSLTW